MEELPTTPTLDALRFSQAELAFCTSVWPSGSVTFTGSIPSTVRTAPVLAKHRKHLNLVDFLLGGVDRMQRNFEPMNN